MRCALDLTQDKLWLRYCNSTDSSTLLIGANVHKCHSCQHLPISCVPYHSYLAKLNVHELRLHQVPPKVMPQSQICCIDAVGRDSGVS